jgi:hypothetical protein
MSISSSSGKPSATGSSPSAVFGLLLLITSFALIGLAAHIVTAERLLWMPLLTIPALALSIVHAIGSELYRYNY